MEKYYLHLDDEQKGPFTIGQLQSMWKAGTILCNTQFFTKANAEWKPLEAILRLLEPDPGPQDSPFAPQPTIVAAQSLPSVPRVAVPNSVAERPVPSKVSAGPVRCSKCGGLRGHLAGCPINAANSPAGKNAASPISNNMPSFIAALGMCAAFFMPWVTIFGAGLAGNTVGQIGSEGQAAWIILVLAGLSAATHFAAPVKLLNVVAGVAPFVLLFFFANKMGDELFKVLGVGAWATLICGLVLVFAPVKSNDSNSP